jgi:hypothetical protein
MATSARPINGAGALAIRVGASWIWLGTLWAKIEDLFGLSTDWIGNFFEKTTAKIPIPVQLTDAVGGICRATEAVTSFAFTKVFIAIAVILHKYFNLNITVEYFQYVIIGVTMIVLTYQFSEKRYFELLKIESAKLNAAAIEAANEAKAKATKKRFGAAAIGAGVGLILSVGSPLGAIIGGLIGSMLSDASNEGKESNVEIKPAKTGAIKLKAFFLGTLASIIYTVLLVLITLAPKLDPQFTLNLEGENLTQSSHSATPKSAIMWDEGNQY